MSAPKAPRVVGDMTNMETAAIAAKARDEDGADVQRKAVEWGAPTVNSVPAAVMDMACRVQRLWAIQHNALELIEEIVTGGQFGSAGDAAFEAWMMLRVVEDDLLNVERALSAIEPCAMRLTRGEAA